MKSENKFFSDLVTNPGDRSQISPHLILFSDNGPDEAAHSLTVALPLFMLFLKLNLDVLEKYQCTPGNSKENPVEMGNRTVKRPLKGRVIQCLTGTKEEYTDIIATVSQLYSTVTHAGLPMFVEPGYSLQQCQSLFPYTAQIITNFITARQKNHPKSAWMDYSPNTSLFQEWRNEKR